MRLGPDFGREFSSRLFISAHPERAGRARPGRVLAGS